MKNWRLLPVLLAAIFCASCSLSNPLSELSWGEATIVGRVTRSTAFNGLTIYEGVPGAYIKTDSGTEQTRTNEEGYYTLTVKFRVGSAAKEKKISVKAFDYVNQGKTGTVGDIIIRNGFITEVPPITWGK